MAELAWRARWRDADTPGGKSVEKALDKTEEIQEKELTRFEDSKKRKDQRAMKKLIQKIRIRKEVKVPKSISEKDLREICEKTGKKVSREDQENWYLH